MNVLLFFAGRIVGYLTGKKEKAGFFEHNKQRNNVLQHKKLYLEI